MKDEDFLEKKKIRVVKYPFFVKGELKYFPEVAVTIHEAYKAVDMTKLETAKQIFDWLDNELIKKNRLFAGQTQEVLAEGETKFLQEK